MAMTFKAIIKVKTHQAKSPSDIDQISNSLHDYIERAFEEDQAILNSHNVVTDCVCKSCHRDDTEAVYAEVRDLKRKLINKENEILRMREAFGAIKQEMLPQASNRQVMQIARPARTVINWCKQWV